MGIAEAKEKFLITNAEIEAVTRQPGGIEMQRWQDARLAGTKTTWSVLHFDEICDRVAAGMTVDAAIVSVRGVNDGSFYRLINRDPDMKEQYREAQAAAMFVLDDSIVAIADDKTGDIIINDKGPAPNMANVTRAKLQIDARRGRMGSWNSRFAEKKDSMNVQVNINHAEHLEADRERAKLRGNGVTPKQMQSAIDATFSEKPAAPPAAVWVDDEPTPDPKPLDTMWREEK
jgi:hypothetical protein